MAVVENGGMETVNHDCLAGLLNRENLSLPIHVYSEIDSTNTQAMRLLQSGNKAPFAVLAERQTKGRGRMGREWFSADSGNLYLSFGFEPDFESERIQCFTLWLGLAICAVLNDPLQFPVALKWPNDIVYNGKKLAGMLTETRVSGAKVNSAIFGLGLNVNSSQDFWPVALQNTACSLCEISGKAEDINLIAATVIQAVLNAFQAFLARDWEAEFKLYWQRYDAMRDHTVTISLHDENFTGRACGVDAHGALLVQLPNNEIRSFQSGEASLHAAYYDK